MADEWLLVRSDVIPDVYRKVLQVTRSLSAGRFRSVSEAARVAGISRSAYYKYKDAVAPAPAALANPSLFTVDLVLQDRPGVLSALLSAFAHIGANIITVHQQSPTDGCANVSICASANDDMVSVEQFAEELSSVPGVRRVGAIRKAEK